MRYKEGDLVTIRIDKNDAYNLSNGFEHYSWRIEQIVAHKPVPFNWNMVRAGMAFYEETTNNVWLYTGPCLQNKDFKGIFEFSDFVNVQNKFALDEGRCFNKANLTREPDHDVEVTNDQRQ